MTFQNSKITKSANFEIIIEDQKVYFSDYPDHPIFERAIFPEEAWELIKINFPRLFDDLLGDSHVISKLYGFLTEEDKTEDCPDVDIMKVIDRFYEITDPNFIMPEGMESAIQLEAHGLHIQIKGYVYEPSSLAKFGDYRQSNLLKACYNQGYFIDPVTGEIINHITGETLQEIDH